MKWLVDNWSLLVVILAVIVVATVYVKKFCNMPSQEQQKKVKEWLLYAVIQAEKEFQGGTGKIKLRYVYDLFVSKFPSLSTMISFETFSLWVDMALEEMRHLIETNEAVSAYISGDSNK